MHHDPDLMDALRNLRIDDPGEVFWLSTETHLDDDALAFRTSCL